MSKKILETGIYQSTSGLMGTVVVCIAVAILTGLVAYYAINGLMNAEIVQFNGKKLIYVEPLILVFIYIILAALPIVCLLYALNVAILSRMSHITEGREATVIYTNYYSQTSKFMAIVESEYRCANCGATITGRSRFCSECGVSRTNDKNP